MFFAITHDAGGRRCEREKFANRTPGALAGTQFEHLTEQHQRDDDGRRLEVELCVAAVREAGGNDEGKEHCHQTEQICRPGADGDQCKHVGAGIDDRPPAANEEGPTRPHHHGRTQRQLHPMIQRRAEPGIHRHADHRQHRQQKDREGEGGGDPEPPRHVVEFGIIFVIGFRVLRFEIHPALGTRPRLILLDLWMHRAGVCGLASCASRSRSFERHAALRAIARLVALDTFTHRTEVGFARFACGCGCVSVMAARGALLSVMVLPTAELNKLPRRFISREKLLPAMLAAEIKRLAVAFRADRGRFIHSHAANGINRHACHCRVPCNQFKPVERYSRRLSITRSPNMRGRAGRS